jgi:hypothetical protein
MIMMILSFILAIVSVVLAAASLLNLIVSYDSDYSDKYRTKCFYLSLGCAILSIAIGYASVTFGSYLINLLKSSTAFSNCCERK